MFNMASCLTYIASLYHCHSPGVFRGGTGRELATQEEQQSESRKDKRGKEWHEEDWGEVKESI